MATTKIFPFNRLISPIPIASTLIRYSSPASNISTQSSNPSGNKVKLFNRFSPVPLFVIVNNRLMWSPSFGAYIYWTDDIDFNGNDYDMSYDEFGSVDKTAVVSLSFNGDYYGRFGQYSSISGFELYPNLQYVEFDQNRNLISLDVSSITNLKYFYTSGCDLSNGINFSNLSQLESLDVYNSKINNITLPEQPNITDIDIEYCYNLESINIPGSGSVDGYIYIYNNYSLNSITVPLNTATNLQWYDNALTNVNVSGSPLIETLDIADNFITSLNFDECPNLKYIYAQDNIFSTQTVDNIFISASNSADTYNLTNGDIYLGGANGLPSSASLSARNNLISRGWNVYYAEYTELYYSSTSTDPNVAAWTYTTASNGDGDGADPVIYTDGAYTYATPNIKTLSVDGLSEINGYFYIDGDNATQQTLESVNFNNLPNLANNNSGELYIANCRKLTSISVTDCPSVTDAYFYDNYNLTSINLSGSTNITRLDVDYCFNLTNLDLSQLPNLQQFDGYNTFSITSYDFTNNPSLTEINIGSGGGGGQLFSNLTSVDCSGLSSLTHLDVGSNPKLTSLNISGSTALTTIYINDGCGLSTIDLTQQTSLTHIWGYDSAFLTVDLPITNTLQYVSFYSNQLTAAGVNKILVDLVTGGATGGSVYLDGSYINGVIQNAIPDSTSGGYDGLDAIDTLVSRGWTVSYNSP